MRFSSRIVRGHGRGKLLGFPTFNLQIPPEFDLKPGVYSTWVWIESQRYRGALHFGPVPTFDQAEQSLEVFVLDYDSDAQIESLAIEPMHYLREIRRFDTEKALHDQISHDVEQVRQSLVQR